jgi:hypothetical protein
MSENNKKFSFKLNRFLSAIIVVVGGAMIFMFEVDPGAGFIGFILFVFGIISYNKADRRAKSTCKKCGSSMSGAAYDIQEVSREHTNSGALVAKIEFSAECPSCKKEKIFTKNYTVVTAGSSTNSPRRINIDREIEKDAKKYFGH